MFELQHNLIHSVAVRRTVAIVGASTFVLGLSGCAGSEQPNRMAMPLPTASPAKKDAEQCPPERAQDARDRIYAGAKQTDFVAKYQNTSSEQRATDLARRVDTIGRIGLQLTTLTKGADVISPNLTTNTYFSQKFRHDGQHLEMSWQRTVVGAEGDQPCEAYAISAATEDLTKGVSGLELNIDGHEFKLRDGKLEPSAGGEINTALAAEVGAALEVASVDSLIILNKLGGNLPSQADSVPGRTT